MDFENLPPDWPSIPLTDPDHIADVLDIFVGIRDRMVGSLLILVCDDQRRPLQPIVINEIPVKAPPAGDKYNLARIAETVAETVPGATVLCAVARRGPTRVTRTDQRWAATLQRAFAGRLELLGVHLVTPDGTAAVDAAIPTRRG